MSALALWVNKKPVRVLALRLYDWTGRRKLALTGGRPTSGK
jgi:hypothetical protein